MLILYRTASLAISFDEKTLKMSNGTNLCLVVKLVDIKNALLIDNKAFYSNFVIGIEY